MAWSSNQTEQTLETWRPFMWMSWENREEMMVVRGKLKITHTHIYIHIYIEIYVYVYIYIYVCVYFEWALQAHPFCFREIDRRIQKVTCLPRIFCCWGWSLKTSQFIRPMCEWLVKWTGEPVKTIIEQRKHGDWSSIEKWRSEVAYLAKLSFDFDNGSQPRDE
jgi:hypothetical protein